jgi:hypothetical protein
MRYSESQLRSQLESLEKKQLSPELKLVLTNLLVILVDFLYKWFLTPEGERKPFFRALLVVFYNEFWKDLFGLKDKLDETVNKL